jgi:hypothetical protein
MAGVAVAPEEPVLVLMARPASGSAPVCCEIDVAEHGGGVVIQRLQGVNNQSLDGQWREFCPHRLDVDPVDLVPAGDAADAPVDRLRCVASSEQTHSMTAKPAPCCAARSR